MPMDAEKVAAVVKTDNQPAEMDKNHCFAVISDKAGHFSKDVIQEISEVFSSNGITVEFYHYSDAAKVAGDVTQAQIKGCYSFLAVGGDGTVGLLASSLYGKPHRLAIIPVGTTNTLARTLGIPLVPKEAINVAASSNNVRAVDGLEVNGKIFILNVSMGLSSISLDSVDSKQKSKFGVLAYVLGIIRNYKRITAYSYDLQIDGISHNTRAVEIHVTNIGVIGVPQLRVYQNSCIDDGKAEVLSLRHRSFREFFNLLLDILTRRKRQAIRLIGKGEDIIITSKSPIAVQADGDILQETPVRIKVLSKAINIVIP